MTGSHKSKSQHEHNTKSRAKKVVRGISSEQIGLIQEVRGVTALFIFRIDRISTASFIIFALVTAVYAGSMAFPNVLWNLCRSSPVFVVSRWLRAQTRLTLLHQLKHQTKTSPRLLHQHLTPQYSGAAATLATTLGGWLALELSTLPA